MNIPHLLLLCFTLCFNCGLFLFNIFAGAGMAMWFRALVSPGSKCSPSYFVKLDFVLVRVLCPRFVTWEWFCKELHVLFVIFLLLIVNSALNKHSSADLDF